MLDASAVFGGAETTMRAARRAGEPFTFGAVPSQVPGYLNGRGSELVRDERVSDVARRFYPAGRCPAAPYYHVVESRKL
ncbi:MAG: hypothetical protein ABSA02_37735 [Trebonia sp.]|jgi:hypothetical protein